MKKVSYAITRHGSNSANQSMCEAAEIDIISAHSKEAAVSFAYKKAHEGRYTLYANQTLSARPLSSLSKTDRQLLEETVYLEEEKVKSACIICGKPLGKLPQWKAQNAWCGCDANDPR